MVPGRNCSWNDDSIERYSMQTLAADEAAVFEEHLLICETCQGRLAREDAFGHAIRYAALQRCGRISHHQARMPIFKRLVPVLACAAVALLFVLAGWRFSRRGALAPAIAVQLRATRGAQPGSQVPAGRRLALQADTAGLPPASSYRLELVDQDGRAIWKGTTANSTIDALRPGLYFLRVDSPAGNLLREYGLEAR